MYCGLGRVAFSGSYKRETLAILIILTLILFLLTWAMICLFYSLMFVVWLILQSTETNSYLCSMIHTSDQLSNNYTNICPNYKPNEKNKKISLHVSWLSRTPGMPRIATAIAVTLTRIAIAIAIAAILT